jgi:uncharacterized membrane protein YsdA (DUF1294 family)
MPTLTPTLIIGTFILLNTWTFMLFGFDKLRAEASSWRIAESTLLGFALIGGSGGALLGRRFFRHKTRKEPFSGYLYAIVVLQAICAVVGAVWLLAYGPPLT